MTAVRRSSAWPGILIFAAGLAVFAGGSGPLLVTMAMAGLGLTPDPNPNPVLFGIMALFTFWPGLAVMAVGLTLALSARRKGADDPDGRD